MESQEAKIIYKQTQSVSSFFIHNLAQVLRPSVTVQHRQAKEEPLNAFNVEVKYPNNEEIYGELSAASVICSKASNGPIKFLGESLFIDHWISFITSEFREIIELAVFENDRSKNDEIKNALKEIQAELVPEVDEERKGPLEVLIYSYLSPVKKLLNGKMQTFVKKLGENLECVQPDEFFKKAEKKVVYSESDAKLVRSNKGQEILPVEGERNILITSALPYVNNVPHLGNIIGCVLSADVYARYCRLMKYNTLYICGTDEYGTATETKALEEGKTCKEICDHYYAIHKGIYEWFDCDFDHFGRTSTEEQTKIAQSIFWDCHKNGFTYPDTVEQLYCGKCERFLADRFVVGDCYLCGFDDARGDQCDKCGKLINAMELKKPKCKLCGEAPFAKDATNIYLDLTKIQGELDDWVEKSSVEGKWSQNSISTTKAWLKEGLKGRCITRDLKWGTPVPLEGFTDKVFYVWFDAPIGYLSITNTFIDKWEQWWKNPDNVKLYQFMGKDNVPFHCVVFPSTLLATKDNWTLLHHINTTEYLNYESGKFSKTRGIGVFGDHAAQTGIKSEVWRYYLLSCRPEQNDSLFNWDDFASKNNNELIANLGNFSNRALQYTFKNFDSKVPERKSELTEVDIKFINEVFNDKLNEYYTSMEQVRLREGLSISMAISKLCNGYFQETEPFKIYKTDFNRCSTILNIILNVLRLLCATLEPFIPSFSAKIYEQLNLQRTAQDENLLGFLKDKPAEIILTLLTPGHQMNVPNPVFKQISDEDCQNWRERFSGKQ